MDIKDIQRAKERCEIGILTMIESFEARTSCRIERVNVIKTHEFGKQPKVASVEIDVKVP